MFRRVTVLWLSLALFAPACSSMRPLRPGYGSFERGLALFDQGRFDDAIPYFRRATAEDPEFGEAFLYLGRAYLNTRRWRDAIQPLRAAYRLAPAETKDEVFNFLLDALFAAAGNSLPYDRSRAPDRLQDTP